MSATPLTATTFAGLTASATVATTDIFPVDVSGTTKKITAGNFRTSLFAFGASDPLNCGILTATGNSTITGTLSGITTLTTTNATITTATIATAVCTTISGNGQLNALFVTGVGAVVVPLTAAGATNQASLELIDFQGRKTVIRSPNSGVANGQVGTASNHILDFITNNVTRLQVDQSGSLVFATAVSKIVPGATSLSHRNNADSADNLLITDAGIVSTRGAITTGAAAGDVVLANAVSIKGVNAAGTTTKKLLRFNAADRVEICPDGDDLTFGGSLPALGGGAAPTLGTIGGTGPAAAAQFGWMKFYTSGGTAFYCPTWR